MKPDLLAVLVADEAFRAHTLSQTRELARRRRRTRVVRRVLGAASLLLAIAWLLRPSLPTSAPSRKEAPSFIVRTRPLAAGQHVRTQASLFIPVASTSAGLTLVARKERSFTVLETPTAAPTLELLSDQQLLSAFPSSRPALVAHGTTQARLVFY